MRIRNLKNKLLYLNECPIFLENPLDLKGNWSKEFKNDNPIHLEIGSGLLKFIIEKANNSKDINYIGMERIDTVIARGIKRFQPKNSNLRLINFDASKIDLIFDHEIDTIYLNFSDPWPKKKHAKRRLTSPEFLKKYDKIFKNGNTIIQKTDNKDLFAYSLMELSKYNYILDFVTLDLQKEQINDNILTEYEIKFVEQSKPIYMLKATKSKEK